MAASSRWPSWRPTPTCWRSPSWCPSCTASLSSWPSRMVRPAPTACPGGLTYTPGFPASHRPPPPKHIPLPLALKLPTQKTQKLPAPGCGGAGRRPGKSWGTPAWSWSREAPGCSRGGPAVGTWGDKGLREIQDDRPQMPPPQSFRPCHLGSDHRNGVPRSVGELGRGALGLDHRAGQNLLLCGP